MSNTINKKQFIEALENLNQDILERKKREGDFEIKLSNGLVGKFIRYKKDSLALILNSVPGPEGEQGGIGDTGEQGLEGLMGKIGPQGDKGDKGKPGAFGHQGGRGPKGEGGEKGFTGLKGEIGLRGEKGERGLEGLLGKPGLKGDIGDIGLTGDIGVQGLKGIKGDRGERGIGVPGERGERGIQGEIGVQGSVGPEGKQGLTGKTPDHEWGGTQIRFKKSNDKWGAFVDLKGPPGEAGAGRSILSPAIFTGPKAHERNSDPTVNDDEYKIGDTWINVTSDTSWILVDDTKGAAVWIQNSTFWNRTGTVLSPKTADDDISLEFGDLVSEQNPDTVDAIRLKGTANDVDVVLGDITGYFNVWNVADNNAVFYVDNRGNTDIARDLTVDGTIINTDFTTLTDNSMADILHRHSELSASDGTPDAILSIDAAGKVGIGTASPRASLEINGGDSKALYIVNSTNTRIVIGDTTDASDYGELRWDTTGNYLGLDADLARPLVLQEDGGNVGIGATSPFQKLTLTSGHYIAWETTAGQANSRSWGIRNDLDNYGDFSIRSSDANDNTLDTTRLVIDKDGNVGIGVTDPDTKLEVFNAGNQLKLSFDGTDNTIFAVDTNGDLTITPSGTKIILATSLVSDADVTDDLGTGDVRWNDAWFATLSAGLTATDTLKLRGRDVDGSAYIDILTITSNNVVTADLNALVTIGGNAILDVTSTTSALTTVGALNSGSITSGFGTIDNGTSNITTGGIIAIDVDGSGAGAAGSLTLGAAGDAAVYFDGNDLVLLSDGAGAQGIVLDAENDEVEVKYSGNLGATFSLTGLNLVAGDAYYINGTSVLNATTLGANIAGSSLTSVGTIGTGTWEATDVGTAHGGTGQSTHAKRTIVLTAAGGAPSTTNACSDPTKVETGATTKDYWVLDFAANETAFWDFLMPLNWDGDTSAMTATFHWTNATGASATDTVIWGIQGIAIGNDEVYIAAYGTQRTVTDTLLTAGRHHISGATSLSFMTASPASGELVIIEVERTGGTMSEEARLLAVYITYTTNAYEDWT